MSCRQAALVSMLLLSGSPCLAGKLTAVISPLQESGLSKECRIAFTEALSELGLEVLARDADAATADVEIDVSCGAWEGKGVRCGLEAYLTPTGVSLGHVARSAPDLSGACRATAAEIGAKVKPTLEKLVAEGLPHVLILRWGSKVRPDPFDTAAAFFKDSDLAAKLYLMTESKCIYRFKTDRPAPDIEAGVEKYLKKHYRISREPPSHLPRTPRTYMYLIRKR